MSESTNQKESFSFESLEALRKKLLDLTGRNSLLHYRHPKSSCIRIVDELPNQIVEVLKSEKVLTFLDVAEPTQKELIDNGYIEIDPETNETKKLKDYPTAKQWAKHLGFDTNYELPNKQISTEDKDHHQDSNLQSVLYASQLDARLRQIRSTSETAIEESGASILFLGIGFLEWYESKDSDTARMAPLYTLPVKLERSNKISKQGKFTYSIRLKDDGLLTNITLREKLANDFNLSLPSVQDDTSPEDYFQLIEETILCNKPRWKIRRQVTLLMLNFTKQAMYQDLDPNNWPDDASIQDHPLIAKFFGANQSGSSNNALGYEKEHQIDDIPEIHDKFPLIFDADSSQHSALIDAVNGESLVIEGPPGSGKSQTITNLIAAAIANGKKVLFVAEKMAALNVVKDRLDKAGLGGFCLELHSHKTNKLAILNALGTRISEQSQFRNPVEIKVDIARFEDLKSKLRKYVDLINDSWARTGLSIHQILNKATRYREKLKINPDDLKIQGIQGDSFTSLQQRELFDQADSLKSIYDQTSAQTPEGLISNHYWYGVNNTDLMGYQADSLKERLENWTKSLENLNDYFRILNEQLQFDTEVDLKQTDLEKINSAILSLSSLKGGEILSEIEYLVTNLEDYEQWLKGYLNIHNAHKILGPVVHKNAILGKDSVDNLDKALNCFTTLGIATKSSLEDISLLIESVKSSNEILDTISSGFEQITPNIPKELGICFESSIHGFEEFQVFINLVNALPDDLWRYRDDIYDNPDLDPLLRQMTQELNVLTPLHKNLHEYFQLHRIPETNKLKEYVNTINEAGLFKWFSSSWRETRRSILSLSAISKPDIKALFQLMPDLIRYSEGINEIDTLNKQDDALQELYTGIDTPIDRVTELRGWYRKVRSEYGLGFGDRVGLGNSLLSLDRNIAMSIKDIAQHQLSQSVEISLSKIRTFSETCSGYIALQDKETDLRSSLQELSTTLEQQLGLLESVIKGNASDVGTLNNISHQLRNQQLEVSNWLSSPLTDHLCQVLPLSILPSEASKPLFEAGANSLAIGKVVASEEGLLTSLSHKPDKEHYQALIDSASETSKHLRACKATQKDFVETGGVQVQEWMESSKGRISGLINKNRQALDNPNWLNTWLDYIRLRNKLSAEGLENIINHLELHLLKPEQLKDVVKLCTYHQLSNEIFANHPSISSFNGMEQMAYRKKFQEYDRKLMKLQQELVAYKASRVNAPEGISSGRVGDYTEIGLIRHNLGLKRPRIAVRSLLKRSGTSMQALKPCFMMSPMSVAQYMEPGQFNFDIVVMDEASQIRPEDALGAIARGQSLVVVGDPKQLPPTSFFQKVLNNDDNEDIVGLEESESILDSVLPMFKNRRLRWHYRSRHEKLIAFSNYHFYDGDLILFPSPLQESEKFGVRYSPVPEGCFISRRNTAEAKAVVVSLIKHLIEHPKESVGVVAMNSEQSDEIEQQFQTELTSNETLQKAYEDNQNLYEPLFIKNLENVQGDERDVIMISMTYGPESQGATAMHQRFGPINSDVGWRRLNVLFTRSKMRMQIFSSMTSGHIKTHGTSSRGVVALKAFLTYCETGNVQYYEHTEKAADSDFEIAVMDALAQHGFQCEPQLGVTGYFLDIAVKDPDMPGRFLMGIECDGASYHSAKSTRDRDRLRQEILENLGWKIRRIWSTDWFKNPQAQLEPILQELNSMRRSSNTDKSEDSIQLSLV